MNNQKLYIAILVGLTAIYIVLEISKPKPVDWSDSFVSSDTKPLGTYILKNELPVLFPGHEITTNQHSLFNLREDSSRLGSNNWVFINASFGPDEWETELMLKHLEKGGYVFIAARNFTNTFADTLNLETKTLPSYYNWLNTDSLRQVKLKIETPGITQTSFSSRLVRTAFSAYDTTRTEVLGTTGTGETNFIKTIIGDGALFLHSNPELFTNYVVRDTAYTSYTFGALSHLPVRDTMWDEYYKVGRAGNRSPLRFIVSREYLSWAWFTAIAGVFLFMFFRSKREQRIIPVINPPKNSSIQFASTIAQLYLEQTSHKEIANKKIRFFMDYLRTELNLDAGELSPELAERVAVRTGIPRQQTDRLFMEISKIQSKSDVSVPELTSLTTNIDNFYQKSER